ncbi:protein translocase subunit SecF [Candidatus Wolfebacteria bacterium]|nr:protein translocase subunit SecF [Candidatus Wolfebacteria bacterium]
MNLIKYKYIFFFISGIMIAASIFAFFNYGLKPGIDFSGGTLWQLRPTQTNTDSTRTYAEELKNFFENELNIKNVVIYQEETSQSFIVRLAHISEEEHQQYLQALNNKFSPHESASSPRQSALVEEIRYETIGPAIGAELKNKAIWAIILVIFGISLYVAYAFRQVSYPVKSWKYGLIVLITLFHDVVISAGLLAYLGIKYGVELDTKFIVALLVILGFSVHDTIVVFDRIRENLTINRVKENLENIINVSVNQTFARSVNTSLTLVLVLLTLFFYGPLSLKYFVLLIMVGTIVGTYSSIFIASPMLLYFRNK